MIVKADDVFEGAVVALNLALGHGMVGFATNMANIDLLEVLGQLLGNIGRAIVGQQPWTMLKLDLGNACFSQGDIQCVLNIGGCHAGDELVGNDVARKVVKHRR